MKKFSGAYSPYQKDVESAAKLLLQRWRRFLRSNSAQIGIDLHDDIPALKRIGYIRKGYEMYPRSQTTFHFCDSKTDQQYALYEKEMNMKVTKLKEVWNKQSKAKTDISGCDCYEVHGHPCNISLIDIEFHNADGKNSVENGVRYLGSLVLYLLTKFRT